MQQGACTAHRSSQSLRQDAGEGQGNEGLCFSRPKKLLFFNLGSVLVHAG